MFVEIAAIDADDAAGEFGNLRYDADFAEAIDTSGYTRIRANVG